MQVSEALSSSRGHCCWITYRFRTKVEAREVLAKFAEGLWKAGLPEYERRQPQRYPRVTVAWQGVVWPEQRT
jgi:hypothetical protein